VNFVNKERLDKISPTTAFALWFVR